MENKADDLLKEVKETFEHIKNWSPLKISALHHMMEEHLDDDRNLLPLREMLRVGVRVHYLSETRELAVGIVEKVNRTRLFIRDKDSGKGIHLPIQFVSPVGIEDEQLNFLEGHGTGRADILAGDFVRFPAQKGPYWISGVVTKRNPKTATVDCKEGGHGLYRVSYHFLEKIEEPMAKVTPVTPVAQKIEEDVMRWVRTSPMPEDDFEKEMNSRIAGQSSGFAANQAGGQKISRNGPCPCGSAKKYKRCCGKNN